MSHRYRQAFLSTAIALLLAVLTHSASAITLSNSQLERIDALFAQYDTPTSPGCALGIMSEGRMIYARGYGMAKLDPPLPIDSTRVFDVGSISKQFTAAAIVLLAQQGKIKLKDNVRKYVPELPNYGTPITINHLLWHTSGLRDYVVLLLLGGHDYPDVTTQQQALEFVKRQRRLNFTPGSRYEYSNTGYFLLALIVERVAGKTLSQFARQQMFNPLAMPQAVFRDRHDLVIPNQALGYAQLEENEFVVYMSDWEQVGDGALQISMEEMQKWDENFYTGQVGGPGFTAEMQRTGKLNNGESLIYARGLQVDQYRGLNRVRHGGDWIGYHANMARFPDLHTTIALFCNLEGIDQYALSKGVIDIALENEFTQPPPVYPGPAPSLPLERFAGTYFSGEKKEVYAMTVEEGVLTFNWLYISFPLISTGPTTFTLDGLPGSTVEFAVQGAEPASAVSFDFYPDEPDEAPRQGKRFTPIAPPDDLNQYAGTYHSPELNVTWTFVIEDGALALSEDPEQIVVPVTGPLTPGRVEDTFHGAAGYLQFKRGALGSINGFKLNFLGMTGFHFERVPPGS